MCVCVYPPPLIQHDRRTARDGWREGGREEGGRRKGWDGREGGRGGRKEMRGRGGEEGEGRRKLVREGWVREGG